VVCEQLTKNWHVDVDTCRKAVVKEFPHSMFNKYHLPWYRNAILKGRISFDDRYIPKEVRAKKASKKVDIKKGDKKTKVTKDTKVDVTPATK
jgi:hypothetical protein